MLQRLLRRRELVADRIKRYAGNNKPQDDLKMIEAQRDRLMKQCSSFYVAQSQVLLKLHNLTYGDDQINTRDKGEARGYCRELEDLQQRWWVDFRELKTAMVKLGVPNYDYPMFKPNEAELARFEKVAGLD